MPRHERIQIGRGARGELREHSGGTGIHQIAKGDMIISRDPQRWETLPVDTLDMILALRAKSGADAAIVPTWVDPGTVSGMVPASHATTHESGGGDPLDLGSIAGLLVGPQVPVGVVTQHESALSIQAVQITTTLLRAQLPPEIAYEDEANVFTLANTFVGATGGIDVITAKITGDAAARFLFNADGKLEWGDGTAAPDVNLYRAAAGDLKTDGDFIVAGDILGGGKVDIRFDENSAASITADIRNLDSTAATLHQVALEFSMADTSAGERTAGLISFQKVADWTSTAGTVDSTMLFQVTRDNVLRDVLSFNQFGAMVVFGDISLNSGTLGLRDDENSANSTTVEVNNADPTAVTLHQAALQFTLADTGLSQKQAGRIKVQKEIEWTSTVSTNDSRMILAVVENNGEIDVLTLNSNQTARFHSDLEIDGALDHDGSTVGLYGTTPVSQASAITKPTGGGTIDAEARTAIDLLIDALGASSGIGVTA